MIKTVEDAYTVIIYLGVCHSVNHISDDVVMFTTNRWILLLIKKL